MKNTWNRIRVFGDKIIINTKHKTLYLWNNQDTYLRIIYNFLAAHKVMTAISLIFIISCLLFSRETEQHLKTIKNSFISNGHYSNVQISISGHLASAIITPKKIKVRKNEVISLLSKGLVYRNFAYGPNSFISISEVLTFTIPGAEGNFKMGAKDIPTQFTAKEDGFVIFSVEYPSFHSNFTTAIQNWNSFRFQPIDILVDIEKTSSQKKFVSPIREIRGSGPIPAFFPNLKVIEKYPRGDSNKKAEPEFLKILQNKSINRAIERFLDHMNPRKESN